MTRILTNTKLIKKVLTLILICTLALGSLGCPLDSDNVLHTTDWHIEMINNTSIELNLLFNFKPERLLETEPFLKFLEFNIKSGYTQSTLIYTDRNAQKLSDFISEIKVFDSYNNQRIHLSEAEIKIMLFEEIGPHVYHYKFEINNNDIF